VTYNTTPPQQNYDFTIPHYTPKEITHPWKTKDIIGVMYADIFNRPNISGGGSILIEYDFKDRPPAFLFEGRPFDPDPIPQRKLSFKDCSTCKDYSTCEKLCPINKKFVYQDRVTRKSDLSFLYGSLLESMANKAVLTWPEMCSSSFIPSTQFDCLTQLENQIIQYRFKGKTYKEIATALSGGRARRRLSVDKVKYHARKARTKLEKNKIYKRKKQHAPKIPPLPFKRVEKIPRLPKKIERGISKIDKRYGTDLRWWYENRAKGKEYPLESLLTMSQEFWKKPVSINKVSINPKTGFCYYPKDEQYKITGPTDNKAWKPFVAPDDYKIKYDVGGEDTSDFKIETRKFNPKTKDDERKDLTEIIQ